MLTRCRVPFAVGGLTSSALPAAGRRREPRGPRARGAQGLLHRQHGTRRGDPGRSLRRDRPPELHLQPGAVLRAQRQVRSGAAQLRRLPAQGEGRGRRRSAPRSRSRSPSCAPRLATWASPSNRPGTPTNTAPAGRGDAADLLTPELDKGGLVGLARRMRDGDHPSTPRRRGSGRRSWFAGRRGGGLALGIAGHVLREGRAGDFNEACYYTGGQAIAFADPGVDCRGRYDAVQSAETMMLIGYVGAGVLAAPAPPCWCWRREPNARCARRARALHTDGGTTNGVVCGGSF